MLLLAIVICLDRTRRFTSFRNIFTAYEANYLQGIIDLTERGRHLEELMREFYDVSDDDFILLDLFG